MACLQLYFSVLVLVAASFGQGTAENTTSNVNGTATIDIKLSVIGEGVQNTTAEVKPPQEGNVSEELKNTVARKVLPEVDHPVPVEEIAAKENKGGKGHKTFIAEPDAIKKDLGGRCSTDKDCLTVNNTNCRDKVCVCNDGFIPSKHSLDKCVKVPSGLSDICEEQAQCSHAVPASECRDGRCECPPNFLFMRQRCWEKQVLGGLCNITEQCEDVKSAICTQGVCDCQPPLIPSPSNKCLEVAGKEYKAVCEEDIQCSLSYGDEARCSHGQCRCTNNYHYNGSTCVTDKKLGDPCSLDAECEVSEMINEGASRICLDNMCTCAIGFSVLPGEDICTESSGSKLTVTLSWILCFSLLKFYLK